MRKQNRNTEGRLAPDSLGSLIRAKRERENLTQFQAAEAWGIPISTLTSWEQGIRTPRGIALAAIKQLLGG